MRKHDWPERLNNTVETYRQNDFKFGEADCWLFVTDVIGQITTNTLFQEAKDAGYTCAKSGMKAMKKAYGVKRYIDLPNKFFTPVDLRSAMRGDLVRFDKAFGICMGQFSVFLRNEGMVHIPTTQCQQAWRVE